jgi:hypothetical protein
MAKNLLALNTGHALLPTNVICILLVLISVRDSVGQAAVARSIYFTRGLKSGSYYYYLHQLTHSEYLQIGTRIKL